MNNAKMSLEKTGRNSNFELLRIVSMFFIVAHHFVFNSGVMDNWQEINLNVIFLQIFGMWGKTAINVFVLISGFFLCEMSMTWQRWFKVYLQYKGYRIVIFIIFLLFGYEALSFKGVFSLIFDVATGVNNGFVASFLFFYMLVPFLNLLIERLDKRIHLLLIGILLCYFSVFGTLLFAKHIFSESAWYIVLYFVASYIRKYPSNWMNSFKKNVLLFGFSIIIAIGSVLFFDFSGIKGYTYTLVIDSNKLLAFTVALFGFLTFKNMKPRFNRPVNMFASTMFGVLCIHASSDAMRTFLWRDIVDVRGAFYMHTWRLMLYSFGVVFAIMIVCSVIDYIRMFFVERPLFSMINKKSSAWTLNDKNIIRRLLVLYNSIK